MAVAGIFSQHVAALAARSAIDATILDEVKNVLRSELRRRGITEFGPALLGYLGSSWHDAEALDDLAHDAYVRAIATRLRGLRANLEQSGDVEKLVRKNIRTFVGERQARFDPVGFAVFQNVKAAVVELSELGVLKGLDTAVEAISGASQFEFGGGEPDRFPDEGTLKVALRATGQLTDSLDLQTRLGRTAQERIAEAIRLLPGRNITRFSVGTIKKALCDLLAEAGIPPNSGREVPYSELRAEIPEIFRTRSDASGYEEVENYERLLAGIRQAIDDLPRSAKVKARLRALLVHFTEAISSSDPDRRKSLDDLAGQFGVPRSTLHDDFQSLRSLVKRMMQAQQED